MPEGNGDTAAENTVVAYLGLGSSLGDRLRNLRSALDRLQRPGIRVAAVSPVYESPHLGLAPGDSERYPPHLNLVAKVETSLPPAALLDAAQAVETAGGRERRERWGPRTIDVDILDYNGLQIATERLSLPHPGLTERAFAARPLADIAPEFRLPGGALLTDYLNQEPLRSQQSELSRASNSDEFLLRSDR
jgi:2-amino-4-hydroxy-6-hydroxymethyldihydropteridine diphosphokinase